MISKKLYSILKGTKNQSKTAVGGRWNISVVECKYIHLIIFNVYVTFQVQINARTLISVTSLNVHVDTCIINVRVQFQESPSPENPPGTGLIWFYIPVRNPSSTSYIGGKKRVAPAADCYSCRAT